MALKKQLSLLLIIILCFSQITISLSKKKKNSQESQENSQETSQEDSSSQETTTTTLRPTTTTVTTTPSANNFPVRLTGTGSSSDRLTAQGRLEVYHNSEWGLVCKHYINQNSANVACKSMDYTDGTVLSNSAFGYGSGTRFWLDDVRCTGSESHLSECTDRGWGTHNCRYYDTTAIKCYNRSVDVTLEYRLSGNNNFRGQYNAQGRLEVAVFGTWGIVCTDHFGALDATVACKAMGYDTGKTANTAYYGWPGRNDPIWIDNAGCLGSETRLEDCTRTFWGEHNCNYAKAVSITCDKTANVPTGAMRLYGSTPASYTMGELKGFGIVQIFYGGSWGSICTRYGGWGNNEKLVACRTMGYTEGRARNYYDFGRSPNPIQLKLQGTPCTGTERTMMECTLPAWRSIHGCHYGYDAGLQCYNDSYTGPIMYRLAGNGAFNNSLIAKGRLEVYYNNEWGTVCNHHFGAVDATVACRSLGYTEGSTMTLGNLGSAASDVPYWMDDVGCTGNEQLLHECPKNFWGEHNCNHRSNDMAVHCSNTTGPDFVPDFRLAGGAAINTPQFARGYLQINIDGSIGTVCKDYLNVDAVRVYCKEMGYTAGKHATAYCYSWPNIGCGSGPIHLDDVRCNAQSNRFSDCTHRSWGAHDCNHNEDIILHCSNTAEKNFTLGVRVAGTHSSSGPNVAVGRLEVEMEGLWGTVCSMNFDDDDAAVACRSMGYTKGTHIANHYGQGTGIIWMTKLGCVGNETSLKDCTHAGWGITTSYCSHGRDVAVRCVNEVSGMVPARLTGTNTRNSTAFASGRFELYYNGAWGTVCSHYFSAHSANVACKTMGYTGGRIRHINTYGIGRGSIVGDDVRCTGTETSLDQCPHNDWGVHNCNHNYDIGLQCYSNSGYTLGARVAGSGSSSSATLAIGRLEVSLDGDWGTVCSTHFDSNDAKVACKTMGYERGTHIVNSHGQGTGPIWMVNVHCAGTEPTLDNCTHSGWGMSDCNHRHDVSVRCVNDFTGMLPARLTGPNSVNTTAFASGRFELFYNGAWGTVCSHHFSAHSANIACKTLGYDEGKTVHINYHGRGSGPIVGDDIVCDGTESGLEKCSHADWGVHNCNHNYDVALECTGQTGAVSARLVGTGSTSKSGRAEVFLRGQWGVICSVEFSHAAAAVLCRSLDHDYGARLTRLNPFGYGTGSFLLGNVNCRGDEANLGECDLGTIGSTRCSHHHWDTAVRCYDRSQAIEEYRFAGMRKASYRGRVEVKIDGEWGTICDKGFTDTEATVLCRSMGFSHGYKKWRGYSGRTRDLMIWIQGLSCTGQETDLSQCTREEYGHTDCNHNMDVAVDCWGHTGSDNVQVRLAGPRLRQTPTLAMGMVEVLYNGTWGTVCSAEWFRKDATVVCRMLGYSRARGVRRGWMGRGTGQVWMKKTRCIGNETNLGHCIHQGWGLTAGCPHWRDSGVVCRKTFPPPDTIEMRLVGNNAVNTPTLYRGRLEVRDKIGGGWGTVCDRWFDNREASVACEAMGYDEGKAVRGAGFGRGSGPIWMDLLRCDGTEDSLSQCTYWGWAKHRCHHGRDAGLVCSTPVTVNVTLDVRLAGDYNLTTDVYARGRLEVLYNDEWGTVCHRHFDNRDASVACRMLGYGIGYAVRRGLMGPADSDTPIHIDRLACNGFEDSLLDCPNNRWGSPHGWCNHWKDAGVVCISEDMNSTVEVRLAGDNLTTDAYARGRVEVKYADEWGTISSRAWGHRDAGVVCRMLGYSDGRAVRYGAFGEGSGRIWLDGVWCRGYELSIESCRKRMWGVMIDATHASDAGVMCFSNEPMDATLEVRLVGDGAVSEELRAMGRVEVKYGGIWGSVCQYMFGRRDANVVCQQLGYERGRPVRNAAFGIGSGPIWMTRLRCRGYEDDLDGCRHRGYGKTMGCRHRRTVGVKCSSDEAAVEPSPDVMTNKTRLAGTNSKMEPNLARGRVEIMKGDTWGTVCRRGWDIRDAQVLCASLGYANARAVRRGFGAGRGPIHMMKLRCRGHEDSIDDCQYKAPRRCNHNMDAGVVCWNDVTSVDTPDSVIEAEEASAPNITLVTAGGGSGESENSIMGRIEIIYNGQTSTVCGDSFTDKELDVLCNELGYSQGSILPVEATPGGGSGAIMVSGLNCHGYEGSLKDCTSSWWTASSSCTHAQDVGVVCMEGPAAAPEANLTVVDPSTPEAGIVTFEYNGTVGPVCQEGWDDNGARAMCAGLDYLWGVTSIYSNSDTPLYENVNCTGYEGGIDECTYTDASSTSCTNGVAGVLCVNATLGADKVSVSMRIDSSTQQLQVQYENVWGSVCADGFDQTAADLACLGITGLEQATIDTTGDKMGVIWLSGVNCTGSESDLGLCNHGVWGAATGCRSTVKLTCEALGPITYMGCFKDESVRDQSGASTTSSSMTVENCYNFCKDTYKYYSVQYGSECYCGDTYGRYGTAAESECNMPCGGDSSQMCGSNWRGNLYRINDLVTTVSPVGTDSDVVTAVDSVTDSDVVTAVDSVTDSDVVTVEDSVTGSVTDSDIVTDSVTGAETATESVTASIGEEMTTVVPAQLSELSLGPAFTDVGLFEEDGSGRPVLDGSAATVRMVISRSMTISTCASHCYVQGSSYFGLNNGNRCLCGNNDPSASSTSSSETELACSGASSETCGGTNSTHVYQLNNPITTTTVTAHVASAPTTGVNVPASAANFIQVEAQTEVTELRLVPALNRAPGAVSFQLARDPQMYLREFGGFLFAERSTAPRQRANFNNEASFRIRSSNQTSGIAFESLTTPGSFIVVVAGKLKVEANGDESNGLFVINEWHCRKSTSGKDYMGTKHEAASGTACVRWDGVSHTFTDTDFPDVNISVADNYCRNPDSNANGLWCFTGVGVREACGIPLCEGATKKSTTGREYTGTLSVTMTGIPCQRWNARRPHSHRFSAANFPDATLRAANNYCRNPKGSKPYGPWCFTVNASVEWQYCDVAVKPEDTRQTVIGSEYIGTLSTTKRGYTCQAWSSQRPRRHKYRSASLFPDAQMADTSNFCRNPNKRRSGPWCYTTNPRVPMDYCDVPISEAHCKATIGDTSYTGTLSTTTRGLTCQRWDTQLPNRHIWTDPARYPDATLADAANYCRNPDSSTGGPWCYTTQRRMRRDSCDIPVCPGACSSNPCRHGGTCHDIPETGDFRCDCPTGVSGAFCQTRSSCVTFEFPTDNKLPNNPMRISLAGGLNIEAPTTRSCRLGPAPFTWFYSVVDNTTTIDNSTVWTPINKQYYSNGRSNKLRVPADSLWAPNLAIKIMEISSKTSDYLFVETKATALAVRIMGGSVRTVTYRRRLTIDAATLSYDPDAASGSASTLRYSWSCRTGLPTSADSTTEHFNSTQCPRIMAHIFTSTSGKLTLDTSALSTTNYTFRVKVTSGSKTEVSDQVISVISGYVPTMNIKCRMNCASNVIKTRKLSLYLTCSGCSNLKDLSYSWELSVLNTTTGQYEDLPLTNIARMNKKHKTSRSMVIKKNRLDPGVMYRARAVVSCAVCAKTVTEYAFRTNTPPSGGSCTISPISGAALQTMFTIACDGWASDTPLSYRVETKRGRSMQLLYYGSSSSSPPLPLTIGDKSDDYRREVEIQITDIYGAKTNVDVNVTVTAPSNSDNATAVNSFTNTLVDLDLNNTKTATQYIQSVASVLNADLSDEDTTFSQDSAKQLRTSMVKQVMSMTETVENLEDIVQLSEALGESTQVRTEVEPDTLMNAKDVMFGLLSTTKDLLKKTPEDAERVAKAVLTANWNVIAASTPVTEVPEDKFQFKTTAMLKVEEEQKEADPMSPSEKAYFASRNKTKLQHDRDAEEERAKNVTAQLVQVQEELANAIIETLVPGEEPITVSTEKATLTVQKNRASDMGNTTIESEHGTKIKLPEGFGAGTDYDVEMIITTFHENPYVWGTASKKISTPVTNITFRDSNGNYPNFSTPIDIVMAGKSQVEPQTVDVASSIDPSTQMIYHKLNVEEEGSSISMELTPPTNDSAFQIFVRKGDFPTDPDHDYETMLNATVSDTPTLLALTIEPEYVPTTGIYYIGVRPFGSASNETDNSVNGTSATPSRRKRSASLGGSTAANLSYAINLVTTGCRSWDATTNDWNSKGSLITSQTNPRATACATLPTSTSSAWGSPMVSPPNTIDFSSLYLKLLDLAQNAAVFTTVLVLMFIYVIMLIWALWRDRRDKFKAEPLCDNVPTDSFTYVLTVHTGMRLSAGTKSNVFFTLFGKYGNTGIRHLTGITARTFSRGSCITVVMRTQFFLGPLRHLEVWHDNTGGSWYLDSITVSDKEENVTSTFICRKWLAYDCDDGLVRRRMRITTWEDRERMSWHWDQNACSTFFNYHLWVSVFLKPFKSQFTRAQRVTSCFALLYMTMIASCMFYGGPNSSGPYLVELGMIKISVQTIYTSTVSLLIVLPPCLGIILLFRYGNRKQAADHERAIEMSERLESELKLRERYEERILHADKNSDSGMGSSSTFSQHDPNEDLEAWQRMWLREMDDQLAKAQKEKAPKPAGLVEEKGWQRWKSILLAGWILAELAIFVPAFFVILYSLEWGQQKSVEWLMSYSLSFLQDVLIFDPLKVLLLCVIVTAISYRRRFKISDYDDFFDETPEDKAVSKEARQNALLEVRMYSTIREAVVHVILILLSLVVMFGTLSPHSYRTHNSLERQFVTPFTEQVNSRETFFNWMKTSLLVNYYPEVDVNGNALHWRDRQYLSDLVSFRFGPMRLRQLRVKSSECVTQIFDNTTCYGSYLKMMEDDTEYTPTDIQNDLLGLNYFTKNAWTHYLGHPLDSSYTMGLMGPYAKTGYISKLEVNRYVADLTVQELERYLWLNRQTRAVFLEFAIYNPGANVFGFVTLTAEFLATGGVGHYTHIQVLQAYGQGVSGIFTYLCMGIMAVYFVLSLMIEVQRMIKMRRMYWTMARHYSNWSILVMMIVTTVFFFLRSTELNNALAADATNYVPLRVAALYDDLYKLTLGLLCFCITLKVVFLLRLSKRFAALLAMYQTTFLHLFTFIPILAVFIIAFSFLLWQTLADKVFHFRDFMSTVFSVSYAIIKCFDTNEVLAENHGLGNWAFSLFVVGFYLCLTNVLIVVIIKGHQKFMSKPERECTMDEQAAEILVRKIFGSTDKKTTQADFDEAYKETMNFKMSKMLNTTSV